MLAWLKSLWFNPARDWIIVFLAVHSLVQLDGATNTYSRWAMMVSIVENHTVRIDDYYTHTIDWARTPDGHYYSNKAPGAALLGLPLFWYLDHEVTQYAPDRPRRDAARLRARNDVMQKLSVWTQAVPFSFLVLGFSRALERRGLPKAALHFLAAALLFGNTAAIFMNTYFGHAMAAMFVLAAMLGWCQKRFAIAGLCLGFALLADYGAAWLLVAALVLLLVKRGARWRRLAWFSAGGIVPGSIWAAYHQYCFGSPFALATKFQNPLFLDKNQTTTKLWGALEFSPNKRILEALLTGEARGLLYTQGWLLVAFVGLVALLALGLYEQRRRIADPWLADLAVMSFLGLGLLLLTNCAYNGWHGGATPGPRYLSTALPGCAVAAALVYPRLASSLRHAMVAGLVLAICTFCLVFATKNLLAPENALHDFYLGNLFRSGVHLQRALYLAIALGWASTRAVADSIAVRPPTLETD